MVIWVGAAVATCLAGACASGARGPEPQRPEPGERGAGYSEPQRVPTPTWVADTTDPVVSLRTPHSRAQVAELLDAYFEAIALESNTRLSELLTHDATLHFTPQQPGNSALVGWVRRFSQYDYQTAYPSSLYDPTTMELYTAADVSALQLERDLAFVPERDQLLLRVRLTPGTLSNRFGDELQLLIAPEADALYIRRIYERGFVAQ